MRTDGAAVVFPATTSARTHLELLDWRRRVAELFGELRRRPPDTSTLDWFRGQKDELFRTHPQTPLPPEQRASFQGLAYWPYDPDGRVVAELEPAAPTDERDERRDGTDGAAHSTAAAPAEVAFRRIGTLHFSLGGQALTLGAHWIEGYAGGLFVPFRDATCGSESYGGGRYLLDTIKSADLGSDLDAGTVVLDFNYAYHPSCAYDPQWVCPLAPPDNRLSVPVRCGERL